MNYFLGVFLFICFVIIFYFAIQGIKEIIKKYKNKQWEVKSKTIEHNTIGMYEVDDSYLKGSMDDEDKKDLES